MSVVGVGQPDRIFPIKRGFKISNKGNTSQLVYQGMLPFKKTTILISGVSRSSGSHCVRSLP